MRSLASTSLPSRAPATVALARPAPIDAATSATVTGLSNGFLLPSGSVILIMAILLRDLAGGAACSRPIKKGAERPVWPAAGVGSIGKRSRAHVALSTGRDRRPPRLFALQHER